MSLEVYISESFENGLQYNDAAQLCLRLFCTVDNVPAKFHAECSKANLSIIFANLSVNGVVLENNSDAAAYQAESYGITETQHWLAVIDSIFKVGDTVDSDIGNRLICHITNQ